MKPRSISCYRLMLCFATFACDDQAILKFLVFDPCGAPGSSGAPRKAIGPVSCRSQLPMNGIRQGKSNMRLSARVAYLHLACHTKRARMTSAPVLDLCCAASSPLQLCHFTSCIQRPSLPPSLPLTLPPYLPRLSIPLPFSQINPCTAPTGSAEPGGSLFIIYPPTPVRACGVIVICHTP